MAGSRDKKPFTPQGLREVAAILQHLITDLTAAADYIATLDEQALEIGGVKSLREARAKLIVFHSEIKKSVLNKQTDSKLWSEIGGGRKPPRKAGTAEVSPESEPVVIPSKRPRPRRETTAGRPKKSE